MTVWPPGGPNAFEGFDPQERESEIRPVLELNGVVLFQARENIVDVANNTQGTVGYGGLLGNSWFLATYDTVYHFPADGLFAYPYYYVARGSRIPDANVLDVNAHWRGAMVGIVGDNLDEGEFYDNLQQIHNPAFAHGEALITIRSKLPDLVRENTFNTDVTFKNIRNVKTGQHYPDMAWEAYTTHSSTHGHFLYCWPCSRRGPQERWCGAQSTRRGGRIRCEWCRRAVGDAFWFEAGRRGRGSDAPEPSRVPPSEDSGGGNQGVAGSRRRRTACSGHRA